MGKRKTIEKFVRWCEDNDYTEWMGYLNGFDNVYKRYKEACEAEDE